MLLRGALKVGNPFRHRTSVRQRAAGVDPQGPRSASFWSRLARLSTDAIHVSISLLHLTLSRAVVQMPAEFDVQVPS